MDRVIGVYPERDPLLVCTAQSYKSRLEGMAGDVAEDKKESFVAFEVYGAFLSEKKWGTGQKASPLGVARQTKTQVTGLKQKLAVLDKTVDDIATNFGVSHMSVRRLIAKAESGESLEPGVGAGRPTKLGEHELEWLRGEIKANPYATSYELSAKYNRQFRTNKVHRSTVLRAIRALGYSSKKDADKSSGRLRRAR